MLCNYEVDDSINVIGFITLIMYGINLTFGGLDELSINQVECGNSTLFLYWSVSLRVIMFVYETGCYNIRCTLTYNYILLLT